tara:strand:+ start:2097 stop:2606 length:510 start_codon:yes stop_codon:yes gene_type:complete
MNRSNNYQLSIISLVFLLTATGCDISKKDNFDFSNFKKEVKQSSNNKQSINNDKGVTQNISNFVETLNKAKTREDIMPRIAFGKKDPFSINSENSSEFLDAVQLKGIISSNDYSYAIIDYFGKEGWISIDSIGGINTNFLPKGISVKSIDPITSAVIFVIDNKEYQLKL